MTNPVENCPQPETEIRERAWTAEQVERAAEDWETFGATDSPAMLRAYATTLRQQAEQASGAVSDEVAERALMAFEAAYGARVDGPKSPYANDRARCIRTALEAVAPLLRDGDYWRGRLDERNAKKATKELLRAHAEQGERADEDEDGLPIGYANWYNRQFRGQHVDASRDNACESAWRAALAQNAQGEAERNLSANLTAALRLVKRQREQIETLHAESARVPQFQAGVAEWMGQCFLPSLYSNMTERGDRLMEEVLELLQSKGYDPSRVTTLVDYVWGRPVGEPAQEVGGVMVTLAGFCWIAGLNMHEAGDTELARINQPKVMEKIRRKQEAKNALHFDTPLPGLAAAPSQPEDAGEVES